MRWREEWRRDRDCSHDRDETPCSSSFDELMKKLRNSRNSHKRFEDDREYIDGDEDEDDQLRRKREDDGDEWDIRSSIGLDRTLDNEIIEICHQPEKDDVFGCFIEEGYTCSEEEDEYDKVA